ncbi:protein-tyrosine-phosphatase [Pseudomonas duriflava]|uniref:Protein-tyrosine-phosphatase n=1 Tax=Pseudomonas duriflava TaxID=459528 RepID=A0A562PQ50_9PSED|nr:arsenate reductase ArsC [Pseudomonas duriflava]TWI46310.1 protein-tyrosine-phosphatase [Pseudomonas duriflava]
MKVLFMCTHNRCRSILSEAMFNHFAPEGFEAVSSGSQPSGQVSPLTLEALNRAGITTKGLYSKSSDVFADLPPDIVITVCDRAAGEACPVYFGPAIKAHWGLEDPSALQASDDEVKKAFESTLKIIERRVHAFLALPFKQLNPDELKAALADIGRL